MGCCFQPAGKVEIMKHAVQHGKKCEFRDQYDIGRKLGEGSFGVVFECSKKDGDGTLYAVKMMEHETTLWARLSRSQNKQWDMFAQEFQMLRKMQHPNVIKLYDSMVDPHFMYFVMEKYEASLMEALLPVLEEGKKAMPNACLGAIVHQMLSSIVYLHDQMIVHRDIKADNFLVDDRTFAGREFRVVLTDLGTACELEEGVFLKDMLGTVQYWAPEIAARSYAHKVDVWAIGVILWCMLTMKFPFNNLKETYTKNLTFRSGKMSAEQFELLTQLLEKNYKQRLSARGAIQNVWVKESVEKHLQFVKTHDDSLLSPEILSPSGGRSSLASFESMDTGLAFGDGQEKVAEEVKKRREQNLLEAKEAHERGDGGAWSYSLNEFENLEDLQAHSPFAQGDHVAKDTQRKGEAKVYTWWSDERCIEKNVPDIQTRCDVRVGVFKSEDGDHGEAEDALDNFFSTTEFASLARQLQRRQGDLQSQHEHQAAVSMVEAPNQLLAEDPAKEQTGDIALTEPSTIEQLEAQLKQHNVDIAKFGVGKAKTLGQLFRELDSIECRLMLRSKRIIRVVDYIVLRVKTPNGKLLVQVSHAHADGTEMLGNSKLPAVVRKAGGSGIDMARAEISRLVREEMKADPTILDLNMVLEDADSMSYTKPSKSYPGLDTISRKTFFDATVNTSASAALLERFGLMDEKPFKTVRDDGGSTTWEWWTEEQCQKAGVQIKVAGNVLPEFEDFSAITAGTWTEDKLESVLKQHAIDTEKFGVGEARSLEEFVAETNSGETRLYEKGKELRRHLDLLIVKIKNTFGAYLVETGHSFGKGQTRQRNAFPATKIRPFEDKVWAVRRLLREVDIPFSRSRIMFGPHRVEKFESPSYPGVTTVYLKQVVEVDLEEIEVEVLDQANMGASKWFRRRSDIFDLPDIPEPQTKIGL